MLRGASVASTWSRSLIAACPIASEIRKGMTAEHRRMFIISPKESAGARATGFSGKALCYSLNAALAIQNGAETVSRILFGILFAIAYARLGQSGAQAARAS